MTSFVIGVIIAGVILYLVRKDRVHIRHTFWWVAVALASLVLGAFPPIVDWIAVQLGIRYPPILVLIVGLGLALIKILINDMENSDLEKNIRRLSQRLAILEAKEGDEGTKGQGGSDA